MQGTTLYREKGQNMEEHRETQQEQEARWDAQRTTRAKGFQAGQQARHKRTRRIWLTVAVIVIIAVIAAILLL
jgi:cytochrome c-type biogenesis protein CcmH/NrfG